MPDACLGDSDVVALHAGGRLARPLQRTATEAAAVAVRGGDAAACGGGGGGSGGGRGIGDVRFVLTEPPALLTRAVAAATAALAAPQSPASSHGQRGMEDAPGSGRRRHSVTRDDVDDSAMGGAHADAVANVVFPLFRDPLDAPADDVAQPPPAASPSQPTSRDVQSLAKLCFLLRKKELLGTFAALHTPPNDVSKNVFLYFMP